MDTGSHLLFGATLAGLSMLHPDVAAGSPALFHAILTAALVGSHAPDLDTVTRLRGYSTYLNLHRGVTHSLPALLIWPFVVGLPIAWMFGVWEQMGWVLATAGAAVCLHVLLDWLNAYGVQCFRPFSRKWQHLDVLSLFEPFLFLIHAAGLVGWLLYGGNPGQVMLLVYGISSVYVAIRIWQHARVLGLVRRELDLTEGCQAIPGWNWLRWQFVAETGECFYTGYVTGSRLHIQNVYSKKPSDPLVEASKAADGVRAFLQFAQQIHVSCAEEHEGYVVRWRDVRFWHGNRLPFGVDVLLNRELQVTGYSLGWKKKAWHPPFV
ncbi:metal-dependent hydrolase [Paenibacillus filicis]|uniref:Metal-dependent hydrolase n=1 Tax=Paenibacillus filicis TaxID=669464 RepID=A0ABU9DKK5_9BACL